MSINELDRLIGKYRHNGVLLDSNLLLLYVIGSTDRSRIKRFKRTDHYSTEEYDLISALLLRFEKIATTPSILTEVSNLMGQLSGKLRETIFNRFGSQIIELNETYTPSSNLAKKKSFARLGLTDAAIIEAGQQGYLLLTDDVTLYYVASSMGVEALNLTRLRDEIWSDSVPAERPVN